MGARGVASLARHLRSVRRGDAAAFPAGFRLEDLEQLLRHVVGRVGQLQGASLLDHVGGGVGPDRPLEAGLLSVFSEMSTILRIERRGEERTDLHEGLGFSHLGGEELLF